MNERMNKPILLFDGVCNMCNSLVQFVIKHDKKEIFYFASLQSEAGKLLLERVGLAHIDMDTFVYVDHSRAFIKSSAALRVFRDLGGWWRLLYIGIIVPRVIRDGIYEQVAKRRYKWFGKKEECMLPTPQQRKRFLESTEDVTQSFEK
ncbi:thiol-disulfide oxidoreductase DCC family protein [Bacillus horti]|nr:thiol-disulfide oxidoreductase DCC family protein [Bacillus horti]